MRDDHQLEDDANEASPVAADLHCPATGARTTGRVTALDPSGATLSLSQPSASRGFDIGASVDATFVSSVLGGSRSMQCRVRRVSGDELALTFVSQANAPNGQMFNRRSSLRLRPEALSLGRTAELAWGTDDRNLYPATLEDLSMTGVAVLLPRRAPCPKESDRVRLRLAGPDGLTVWLSGQVRHRGERGPDRRLGIEFDLRIADVEGAGPALRELVRQIERLQLDELVLAFAGIAPDFSA